MSLFMYIVVQVVLRMKIKKIASYLHIDTWWLMHQWTLVTIHSGDHLDTNKQSNLIKKKEFQLKERHLEMLSMQ